MNDLVVAHITMNLIALLDCEKRFSTFSRVFPESFEKIITIRIF